MFEPGNALCKTLQHDAKCASNIFQSQSGLYENKWGYSTEAVWSCPSPHIPSYPHTHTLRCQKCSGHRGHWENLAQTRCTGEFHQLGDLPNGKRLDSAPTEQGSLAPCDLTGTLRTPICMGLEHAGQLASTSSQTFLRSTQERTLVAMFSLKTYHHWQERNHPVAVALGLSSQSADVLSPGWRNVSADMTCLANTLEGFFTEALGWKHGRFIFLAFIPLHVNMHWDMSTQSSCLFTATHAHDFHLLHQITTY